MHTCSCHLSALFKELATYASDDPNKNKYNLAYHTGHHKKEPISHQKLDLLIKSHYFCYNCTSRNDAKYSKHLIKSNTIMTAIHYSDKPVHNLANNACMFYVLSCKL